MTRTKEYNFHISKCSMVRRMVERQIAEPDCFGNLEDEFRKEHVFSGYENGLELGKKAGQEEGYTQGSIEGANKGSEVGFYKGLTMTLIQLLQSNQVHQTTTTAKTKSTKALNKLNEVLAMINAFPHTNETFCEEKLSEIRNKFKQSQSLLNLKI